MCGELCFLPLCPFSSSKLVDWCIVVDFILGVRYVLCLVHCGGFSFGYKVCSVFSSRLLCLGEHFFCGTFFFGWFILILIELGVLS